MCRNKDKTKGQIEKDEIYMASGRSLDPPRPPTNNRKKLKSRRNRLTRVVHNSFLCQRNHHKLQDCS